MFKKFIKDSIIYFIPLLISRGISILLLPIYSRVISPSQFGSLDLFYAFSNIVNLVITLEISQAVARFYIEAKSKMQKQLYASTSFWFTLIIYSIFSIIMISNSQIMSQFVMGESGLELEFNFGILSILITSIFYLIQGQLRYQFLSKEYSFISTLMFITTAGFSVFLTFFLDMGLKGILMANIIGNFIGGAFGLFYLKDTYKFKFKFAYLFKMLKFSYPLVFSSLAIWFSLYIDRIMINNYLGTEQLGIYGVGARLSSIGTLLISGFSISLRPLVLDNFKKKTTPKNISDIFNIFLFFISILFLILVSFSSEILQLLSKPAFYPSAKLIIFLFPACILSRLYIFTPGLDISKKTHFFALINISTGILNIFMNLFLIPIFGIAGAAVATLSSAFFNFILYLISSQKTYFIPFKYKEIIIYISVAFISITFMGFVDQNLFSKIIFALIFFTLLNFLANSLGVLDFKKVKDFLSNSNFKFKKF